MHACSFFYSFFLSFFLSFYLSIFLSFILSFFLSFFLTFFLSFLFLLLFFLSFLTINIHSRVLLLDCLLEFLQEDHHPQAVSTEYTKWFSEISSWHHPPTTVSTGSTKWISAYTSRHHLFCHFSDKMRDKSNIIMRCNSINWGVPYVRQEYIKASGDPGWSYSSLFACL